MKVILLNLVMLFVGITYSVNAQKMTYVKGWGISYQGKFLQKPKEILPVISQKKSPELITAFQKYKSNKVAAQVCGSVGGAGMGYFLGRAISGQKLNGGLLAGGAGVLAIGLIFNGAKNKALRQVVDLYNGTSVRKITYTPFLRNDNACAHIGVDIGF